MNGYDRHIHDELLHYMKSHPFLQFFKEDLIEKTEEWCPFTHENTEVDYSCYKTNPRVDTLLNMLVKYQLCNHFLDSNRYFLNEYTKILTSLQHPQTIQSLNHFNESLSNLSNTIEILDRNVQEKLKNLSCLECKRLDESLVDYSNHCKFSSIIMAVSAVEFRLHWMIRKVDQERYEKDFGKATFGVLIKQFTDEGKFEDIKKLLPERHLPLIQLLNKYRILSAHPKSFDIPEVITDSIVSLSFSFLTDPENSPYTSDELKCPQSPGGDDEDTDKKEVDQEHSMQL